MRTSDTDIFVGHNCGVCGERVHVSKGTGLWVCVCDGNEVYAWHATCWLEAGALVPKPVRKDEYEPRQ